KAIFRKYLKSVFGDNCIGNIYSKSDEYSITGTGEDNRILFEIIETGESAGIKQENPLPFNDATFIESPALINSSKSILASKTVFDVDEDIKKKVELLEKPYAPVYMKDLILKLTEYPAESEPSPIIDGIREIIQGDFYYDHNERDFIYKSGNKTFKSLSIASGINYLGMIIILLKNGFLNKKSLIILDEPETNMHPDWQVRFAEVLVRLIKEGNSILLTSHSPYFIEALQLYADKILEKDKISFYFSHKSPGEMASHIDDVTFDLSPIFDILAKPFG
ncbi:MAG TPA: AAA family ATPase, partial [Candidatus Kapabacteria bacterium]|nr:AAA family ATPase [Candidatus Kapabacteria bacterium]